MATTYDDDDADLAAAIEASKLEAAAVSVPAVGEPVPLAELADEYRHGARPALYRAKVRLLEATYSALRRVRGDGNCFYRSIWVGWADTLLRRPPADRRASGRASLLAFPPFQIDASSGRGPQQPRHRLSQPGCS